MTTPTTWTDDELSRIGGAEELEIIASGPSGRTGRPVPIWVVRVGNELFVRSVRGAAGAWYRRARDTHRGHVRAGGLERDVRFIEPDAAVRAAVDEAYRSKYGRYGDSYVLPMISDGGAATTLRLVPS